MMQRMGPGRPSGTLSKIQELESRIKSEGLGKINLKELIGPHGYAEEVVKEAKLTRVQLRKIFNEFKSIYNQYQKGTDPNEVKLKLYKLYPLLQYQVNRGLIESEKFKDLIFTILDRIDQDLAEFRVAMEFLEALVAYTKKD